MVGGREWMKMKKKVVLLGDSIRLIGYGKKVEEMLTPECEVWQPEDNCRFAKYTLRLIFDFQEQIKEANVIHWNNGLWDVCDILGDGPFSPWEEYRTNMLRIADILQQWGKMVIFATTTPTHPEYEYAAYERTKEYNAGMTAELKKRGIRINDLFSLMDEHKLDGICEDKIHLNEKGIQLCAEQVVREIRKVL